MQILVLLLSIALVQGIEPMPTVQTPTSQPSSTEPTTTTHSMTQTTTPSSTTVTITTQKPTTTDKPNTTTVAPNTTTTVVPSTTTIAPSTTTVAPPNAKVGNWTVKENGTVCILVQMNARVNATVGSGKNKKNLLMNVPTNGQAVASGVCGKFEQNITISWPAVNNTSDNLTIHFLKNGTEGRYAIHHLEIALSEFNSSQPVLLIHEHSEFSTALTNSYRCLKEQTLQLKVVGGNETNGQVVLSDLQFQAFKEGNSTVFGLAKDCAFDTPDVVPIAVGCALAALVVIVLIAYLIGRRRSQSQGYVSM